MFDMMAWRLASSCADRAVRYGSRARGFKYLLVGSAAAAGLLTAHDVQASVIDITAAAPGVMTPSLGSATVLGFDDLPLGGLPSLQFSGGSLSGSGAVENTSMVDKYAQPAGDSTQFLTISYPSAAGSVQLTLSDPENYFGLYWGSIDSYNSISFLNDGKLIATFSGSDVVAATGLSADGNQQASSSNRYIDFYFGSTFYNEVVLGTTQYAFEVDNVAFGDPPTSVPEPNTLPILASMLGMAYAWRRRIFSEPSP